MPQSFHRKREVATSIRAIAVAEIDRALAAISDGDADEAEIIHTVRQQLKRLRALIRLPRGHFEAYGEENAAFRDLGRKLARTRDSDVLRQTYDGLVTRAGRRVPAAVRRRVLAGSGKKSPGTPGRRPLLEGEIASGLRAARERAKRWRFGRKGFPLIAGGLRRVYAEMREGEKLAADHSTAMNFHEWRKYTKYHASQLALLTPVAPEIIKGYRKIADKLAVALGDHHDLDVLRAAADGVRNDAAADPLFEVIKRRDRKLASRAFRLCDELSAERPADFLRRIEVSWKSWRR